MSSFEEEVCEEVVSRGVAEAEAEAEVEGAPESPLAAPSSSSSNHHARSGSDPADDEGFDEGCLEIAKDIDAALKAKEAGNTYFRDKDYDGAITLYSQAVAHCPADEANKENLAVFLGNRAAAYYAIEEFTLVVDDCTLALETHPTYVKVLHRRMQALEKLERLDEALNDAKRIQELDPSWPKIGVTVSRLEKESAEKMEKLKTEALGKLKDIGNSILGNFGMSLDSFKFQQDPNTGSWTIGMNQQSNA